MKTRALGLFAFLAIALLAACVRHVTEDEKISLTDELTARLARLEAVPDSVDEEESCVMCDTRLDSIFRLKDDRFEQDMCCLENDWMINFPLEDDRKNGFLKVAEDMYNVMIASYDIWSDYEVWERGVEYGTFLTDSSFIGDAIGKKNIACIREEKLRDKVESYRKSILKNMTAGEDAWTEEDNPYLHSKALTDFVMENYMSDEKFDGYLDFDALDKVMALDVDSTELAACAEKFMGPKDWLKEMVETEDFQQRCRLSLMAMNVGGDNIKFILDAVAACLASGEYSPLLPRMWRTWRCLCQVRYGGLSRESIIFNPIYNRYRKYVYEAILKHISLHPDDKEAVSAAQYMIAVPNMIRNGQYLMGSDCAIECMEMGVLL